MITYRFLALSVLFLFIPSVNALDFVGNNMVLDYSKANISLIITFEKPRDYFEFSTVGMATNLNTGQNCTIIREGISLISCNLDMGEKRTIELGFLLEDSVKKMDDSYYFSADFDFKEDIKSLSATVTLPEGAVLSRNVTVVPANSSTVSDGRRIIVVWDINDVKSGEPLIFRVLYEPTSKPIGLIIYIALFGVIIGTLLLFYILITNRKKKEKRGAILSVLDEYEKKILEMVGQAGGTIYQRKIIRETGWSNAKVTRVVKRLAERKVIEIERVGRQNRLKLTRSL